MSPVVLTGLQGAVALVLIAAGAMKLADLAAFVSTVEGLGLPGGTARIGARLVALAEVGLGAASLAGVATRVVTVAVLALTLGFLVVAGAAARWRPQVRCRCFGALAESRFGSTTVARSAALVAASAVVVIAGPNGGTHAVVDTTLLLALAVAFAVCCAVMAGALDAMRRT